MYCNLKLLLQQLNNNSSSQYFCLLLSSLTMCGKSNSELALQLLNGFQTLKELLPSKKAVTLQWSLSTYLAAQSSMCVYILKHGGKISVLRTLSDNAHNPCTISGVPAEVLATFPVNQLPKYILNK